MITMYRYTIRSFMLMFCFLPKEGLFYELSGESKLMLMPPYEITIRAIGQSVFVGCRTNDNSVSALKWTGPNGKDIPQDGGQRIFVEREESMVKLYIQNIEEDDVGVYNCSGRDNNGWLTTGFTLETYLQITFEDAPSEQYGILGQEGIIKCVVRSRPQATVNFRKGSKLLLPNDRITITREQVKFNPVTKEDDGVYKCIAMVPESGAYDTSEIRFKVLVPLGYQEENEMKMTCSAGDNDASANLDRSLKINKTWFHGSEKTTCVAKDEAAEESYILNLEMIKKPKIIKMDSIRAVEGEVVVLQCQVSGKPLPEVTMRKLDSDANFIEDEERSKLYVTDDKNLRNATLVIENVGKTDDGQYECTANNKGGQVTSYARLTVEYSPRFQESFIEVRSEIYDKVNLTCSVEANPEATISWIYRGDDNEEGPAEGLAHVTIYEETSISNLEIMPVDGSYFRVYTCIARNKLGEARHNMVLKEADPPGTVEPVTSDEVTTLSPMAIEEHHIHL